MSFYRDSAAHTRPPRRVLLCQPRWLGDVLLCTPAMHALRRQWPGARIDFLTELSGATALEGNPDVDNLLVMRRGAGRPALLRRIQTSAYDAVVDFRSTGSTAVVAAASGAAVRVGTRGRGLRNRAYTVLLPRERRPIYMARQKLVLLAPLGVDISAADLSLRIATGPEQQRKAADIVALAGGAAGSPLVAVSGASRVAGKRWGARHWAQVADRLAAAGARIILTHGPGELDQVRAIAALMRAPALSEYGATTVRELAALYQRCAVWVGNDGGAKHIAAAAGIPTIALVWQGSGPVWNDVDDPNQHFVEVRPGSCPACVGPCLGTADEEHITRLALTTIERS